MRFAVMVSSKHHSPWVYVEKPKVLKISGLNGENIELLFRKIGQFNPCEVLLTIDSNGEFKLPEREGQFRLVRETSPGSSRVTASLEV